MDYSESDRTPLDPDIVDAAYRKANPEVRMIVSSILTGNPDEATFLYSYISNENADKIGKVAAKDINLGFTFFSGALENITLLARNVFQHMGKLPKGADAQKVFTTMALRMMTREDRDAVAKAVLNG